MTKTITIQLHGITVSLDETGKYPEVVVTAPRALLTRAIVRQCHEFAGENGATIWFVTERGRGMIRP